MLRILNKLSGTCFWFLVVPTDAGNDYFEFATCMGLLVLEDIRLDVFCFSDPMTERISWC